MNAPFDATRAEFHTAVETLRMQVDRDTVLQARAALLAEAHRLRMALHRHEPGLEVGLCGGDPVSVPAAAAFNERIRTLVAYCRQYTDDLEAAGHGLGDVARSYGYTEDEITNSFSTTSISPR